MPRGDELFHICWLCCVTSLMLTGTSAVETVWGELGGSAKLPCHIKPEKTIEFLYMQTAEEPVVLVHGFHRDGTKPHGRFDNRTRLDSSKRWVELWDLQVDDEGSYECFVKYYSENLQKPPKNYLFIIANYSKPVIQVREDGGHCFLTCSSGDGYPLANLEWDLPVGLDNVNVSTSSMQDPVTMRYRVSSNITVNSSDIVNVTCTVGNVTSLSQHNCGSRAAYVDHTLTAAYVVISIVLLLGLVAVLLAVGIVKGRSSDLATPVQETEIGLLT